MRRRLTDKCQDASDTKIQTKAGVNKNLKRIMVRDGICKEPADGLRSKAKKTLAEKKFLKKLQKNFVFILLMPFRPKGNKVIRSRLVKFQTCTSLSSYSSLYKVY